MRVLIAFIIGIIPCNSLKICLYKLIFKYQIQKNCRIGFSIIVCSKLLLESGARIGDLNWIYNIDSIILRNNACINNRNIIKNLKVLNLEPGSMLRNANHLGREPLEGTKGIFRLGRNSLITAKHLFDVTDDILIGENTVIGGIGSQFWTHGFDIYRNRVQDPIIIKNNCYLAASCLVNLGVTIESENQIGLGTVVSKSIDSHFGFWTSNQLVRRKDLINLSEAKEYVLNNNSPTDYFYSKKSY
jgi:acetyltransferase-like isoleucine patch superfamily enzyme